MINRYTRTPTLMAQTFATLDEVSNNRTILGVRAANEMLTEDSHGKEFYRPLTRTGKTIDIFCLVDNNGRIIVGIWVE